MFQVFDKGYQLTFANGLLLSVMFGRGNHCANRGLEIPGTNLACDNAEFAVYRLSQKDPIFADGFYDNGLSGWVSPEQVARVTAIVAAHDEKIGDVELRKKLRAALV